MSSFESDIKRAVGEPNIDTCEIAGAVVVAAGRSGTIVERAYGRTSVKPNASALATDATFWIASCSKLLTTIALLQCVERGIVTLDEDICASHLLPEWRDAPILTGFSAEDDTPQFVPSGRRMTARQLLTHSSGMGYDWLHPKLMKLATQRNNFTFAESGGNYVLTFDCGAGWDYGQGIYWAGKVVERVSGGVALEDYFKQHILGPLGMTATTFHLAARPDVRARMPGMTIRKPDGRLVASRKGVWRDPDPDESGGAGLYSSAQDYMKVLTSVLRNDGKLLNAESVDEMFRPQLEDDGYIMKLLEIPEYNQLLTGGMPGGLKVNYGLGGLIIGEDLPTGRRKGSMNWGGYPNLFWWIDREEGICGLYASQIVPSGDVQSGKLFKQFEKSVYDARRRSGSVGDKSRL